MECWTIRKAAARGEAGIVTSQHYAAAEAGAAALEAGGNAVDAAVTAGLLLQTVEPWMSGLSACGYMLVAQPEGTVDVVEFAGRTAAALDVADYPADPTGAATFLGMPAAAGERNVRGLPATVVPGAVRGLATALERFGRWRFDRAMAPAVDRARRGLEVDWHTTLAIALAHADLARDPAAAAIFLPDGSPPEPGTVLPLPQLAATLQRLAEAGPDDLYTGLLAERLARDLAVGGSAITEDDLAACWPEVYPAVSAEIAGRSVHVAGPTSGGRRLHEALAHLEAGRGGGGADAAFFTAAVEALRRAFADHRGRLVGDGDGGSTTHVNAVDREGRMVALTFTLLNRFGARVMSPSTGILLNNGMAWFDLRPGRGNSLRPGAPAPSNMCPVVVTDPAGSFAAMGASGGNQIVPALTQIAGFMLLAGMDVAAALETPRLNAGPTDGITVDLAMDEAIIAALSDLGPITRAQRAVYPRPFASPSAIGRAARGFEGMPDTTYPPAAAVAARS